MSVLDPDELRQLVREVATVVRRGEVLVLRAPRPLPIDEYHHITAVLSQWKEQEGVAIPILIIDSEFTVEAIAEPPDGAVDKSGAVWLPPAEHIAAHEGSRW